MTEQNLRDYTTLRTPGKPAAWYELDTPEYSRELEKLIKQYRHRYILAGGSNTLFLGDFPGLVIHVSLKGVERLEENDDSVTVRVAAGEVWDDFVALSIKKGWYGLENLSLIPGTVGAAPVQNIGAYGKEAKDFIVRVDGFELETGVRQSFRNEDCEFGYRSSVFKAKLRESFVITHVVFKLSKTPAISTSYATLTAELDKRGLTQPTPAEVREAVIAVRSARLPDWHDTPNAGSFFMNPMVPREVAEELQKQYSDLPTYPADSPDQVKLPAAWLIDQAGLKNHWDGNVGTYEHQPLVIVTNGEATGAEIMAFARDIIKQVQARFGVTLTPEVTRVGHE